MFGLIIVYTYVSVFKWMTCVNGSVETGLTQVEICTSSAPVTTNHIYILQTLFIRGHTFSIHSPRTCSATSNFTSNSLIMTLFIL